MLLIVLMNCLQGIQSDTENEGRAKVKRRCRGFNPLSELQDPEQYQTALTSL